MNAVIRVFALAVAVMAAWTASAETVEIPEAPFPMPAIAVPEFAARDFPITAFGARTDGTKCTKAFAAAMTACEKSGGGRVIVPPGVWLTGPIRLKSQVELHLEDGATVVFSDDPADYLPAVRSSWGGIECQNYAPLVYAFGATNVAVAGKGTFAPKMGTWQSWSGRPKAHLEALGRLYRWGDTDEPVENRDMTKIPGAHLRPQLMQFNRCRNVRLEGFSVRESPLWAIHLFLSSDVVVRGLDIRASGRNSDGIDIESSRNVLVEDCRLEQGDDGFVIKSGRDRDGRRLATPTENVLIRNCEVHGATHTMLAIGSEVSGGVRNVCLQDCRAGRLKCLLRVKTSRRKGGFIENVHFRRVKANFACRIFDLVTTQEYQWERYPSRESAMPTRISGLFVTDVISGGTERAFDLQGDPLSPAENVVIERVSPGLLDGDLLTSENVRGSLDGRPFR